jgi:hypothetical protein
MKEQTAIIKKIEAGIVHHSPGITFTIEFELLEGGFCNYFTPNEIRKMLEDTRIDKVEKLVGLPCQVNAGWGEECSFIRMWKRENSRNY